MPESRAIAAADAPRTRSSLAADLRTLGLPAGSTVIVHASLASLGWVAGGPVAVIRALLDVLGEAGTLAMPAFCGGLTEPSLWRHPPVPESWWPVIRAETPAFDPAVTPTRRMGAIAETFRTWPGALRSDHPHSSVVALGPQAAFVTEGHRLEDAMGDASPFGRLYDLDAFVLMLGVENNSSLHLAEHRSGARGRVPQGAPLFENGVRVWKTFQDLDYDDSTFPPVKAAFEATGRVTVGRVGSAVAKLLRQREIVDFATEWFRSPPG